MELLACPFPAPAAGARSARAEYRTGMWLQDEFVISVTVQCYSDAVCGCRPSVQGATYPQHKLHGRVLPERGESPVVRGAGAMQRHRWKNAEAPGGEQGKWEGRWRSGVAVRSSGRAVAGWMSGV